MLIMGIMTAIFIPSMFYRPTQPPLDTFIQQMNGLIQTGVLEAIRTNVLHRIFFDFTKNRITLEIAQQKNTTAEDKTAPYIPVTDLATPVTIIIPDSLQTPFPHFYIGPTEETGNLKTIYFFIGADGSVQEVKFDVIDIENKIKITVMTNPFSGQLVTI